MAGQAKKRILFLSGTRADFGKQKTLMQAVKDAPGFECNIFATGMHMLERYGSTYLEIRKCGFENVFVFFNQMLNTSSDMDIVLANTITGLGHYIREFRPDLIVVHGDRVETLAGAIVGALNNILVAHIEGGEISGTIDELLRHSVSKLAHIHFVANDDAKRRLIQMGETPDNVYVIGSPDIDIVLSDQLPSLDDAKARYGIPFERYGIFCYHPVTTEIDRLRQDTCEIIAALKASQRDFLVIYPNNDSGSEIILEELLKLKGLPGFKLNSSFRFEYYLTLLKHADVLVGNSSAGIHEAPVYGVPTVNIGSRQRNRFNHKSIFNVEPVKDDILSVLRALPGRFAPCLEFGHGNSAELFIRNLSSAKLWQTSPQKQFRDIATPEKA